MTTLKKNKNIRKQKTRKHTYKNIRPNIINVNGFSILLLPLKKYQLNKAIDSSFIILWNNLSCIEGSVKCSKTSRQTTVSNFEIFVSSIE